MLDHADGDAACAQTADEGQDAANLGRVQTGKNLVEQAAKRREIKDALLVAAGALTTAADGPYAADPAVARSVSLFRAAADQIPESEVIQTNRLFAYDALLKANAALRSFELAVASGRVTLH